MEVEHVTGADSVLDRAGPFLAADEARHNLALGILATAEAQPNVYPDVRGWVVRGGGDRVIGAALRTPPHNLVLATQPAGNGVAELVGAIEDDLPGVVGTTPEIDTFAALWAKRHDVAVSTRFEQRIYALRGLRSPRPTDGAMRLAGESDRTLLLEWTTAFADEVLVGGPSTDAELPRLSVEARFGDAHGGFGLWEVAGRPVSLAGFGSPTPNGIRIGPVYTPPEHRGRGYGSAVTAAVSRVNLDRGRRFCFLYTDLANPTSNSIYLRIGYEPVCDSRELAFSPR